MSIIGAVSKYIKKTIIAIFSISLVSCFGIPAMASADQANDAANVQIKIGSSSDTSAHVSLCAASKPSKPSIKSISGGKKCITVKWGRVGSSIAGYQIKYSAKSSVTIGKVVNVGKALTSKKIIGLKAGTRFYVKIRAYKIANGTKVFSNWSSIKSAATAKSVTKSSSKARSSSGGGTVYITNTGGKFHASGCSSLRRSKIAISRSAAISQGYEPCKRCRP